MAGEMDHFSSAIGELRTFVALQSDMNNRVLAELQKISESISKSTALDATFATYRGTLHERFNNIHEHIAQIKIDIEQTTKELKGLAHRITLVDTQVTTWRAQLRSAVTMTFVGSTIVGSLLGYYGPYFIKLLAKVP